MAKASVHSEHVDTWRQLDGKGPRHFITRGYDGIYRPCKARVRLPDTTGLVALYIHEDQFITKDDSQVPLCKNCIKSSPRAKSSARMNQ